MPHQIACPKCAHAGLIRLEHVIQGGVSKRAFYCGSCEHTWEVLDGPAPVPSPQRQRRYPEPRVREIGGGRETEQPAGADGERMARIDQIIQKLNETQRESARVQQRARLSLQRARHTSGGFRTDGGDR